MKVSKNITVKSAVLTTVLMVFLLAGYQNCANQGPTQLAATPKNNSRTGGGGGGTGDGDGGDGGGGGGDGGGTTSTLTFTANNSALLSGVNPSNAVSYKLTATGITLSSLESYYWVTDSTGKAIDDGCSARYTTASAASRGTISDIKNTVGTQPFVNNAYLVALLTAAKSEKPDDSCQGGKNYHLVVRGKDSSNNYVYSKVEIRFAAAGSTSGAPAISVAGLDGGTPEPGFYYFVIYGANLPPPPADPMASTAQLNWLNVNCPSATPYETMWNGFNNQNTRQINVRIHKPSSASSCQIAVSTGSGTTSPGLSVPKAP